MRAGIAVSIVFLFHLPTSTHHRHLLRAGLAELVYPQDAGQLLAKSSLSRCTIQSPCGHFKIVYTSEGSWESGWSLLAYFLSVGKLLDSSLALSDLRLLLPVRSFRQQAMAFGQELCRSASRKIHRMIPFSRVLSSVVMPKGTRWDHSSPHLALHWTHDSLHSCIHLEPRLSIKSLGVQDRSSGPDTFLMARYMSHCTVSFIEHPVQPWSLSSPRMDLPSVIPGTLRVA